MKKNSLLLLLIFLCFSLFGQQTWHTDWTISIGENQFKTQQFTAISFQLPADISPTDITLKIGDRSVPILVDEHVELDGYWQSVLQVFTDSVFTIQSNKAFQLKGLFQYIPSIIINHKQLDLREGNCEMPIMIPPSVWRAGLADPKPNPIATATRHGIIHHSASGNGQTNYTDLVRGYYVYHTQTNGWDDIGYNFLIAYDGTIYIGRDQQQLNVPQYQVQGAHFCSKNVGTFGTCLIGNYSDTAPSDTMLKSLTKLMAWVLYRESISALDSSPHPTATDPFLSNVAGHRQGCATECPGDSTFLLIQRIRDSVEQTRIKCLPLVKVDDINPKQVLTYTLQENRLSIEHVQSESIGIYNLSGQCIKTLPSNKGLVMFDIGSLSAGMYIALVGQQGFIRFLKE